MKTSAAATLLLLPAVAMAQAGMGDTIGMTLTSSMVSTSVLGSTVLPNSDSGSHITFVTTSSGLPRTDTTTAPASTTAVILMSGSTTVTAAQTKNAAATPEPGARMMGAVVGGAVAVAVGLV